MMRPGLQLRGIFRKLSRRLFRRLIIDRIARELVAMARELTAVSRNWKQALEDAQVYMEGNDLEPTSALKQAGSDNGISYGPEMGRFVRWANRQLGFKGSRELSSARKVSPRGEYVLAWKGSGKGYFGGGTIHAPKMVKREDDAIVWTGHKLLNMAYDWKMNWEAIELD